MASGSLSNVGVAVVRVGGPRDGESSRIVSGDPPGVLVVDDRAWVYRYWNGRYWWDASGSSA